jgi:translocator protein
VKLARSDAVALLVFLALSFLAATIGGAFTADSVRTWYPTLVKPSFTPPGWVFGPVWTVLYLMIAASGWLVYRQRPDPAVRSSLVLFAAQLVFNALWSVLFFGLQEPGWALVDLCLLWAIIGAYTLAAWRISRPAALLFLPYWIWVGFAGILNAAIWRLNPASPA